MRMRTMLMVALGVLGVAASGCSRSPDEPTSSFKPAEGKPLPPGPTKLEIEDTKVGTGREAKTGDTVHVQYTGTLMNGVKFDSSRDRGTPFEASVAALREPDASHAALADERQQPVRAKDLSRQ